VIEVRAKLAATVEEPVAPPPTRLARMLALAWLLDDLIEDGQLAGFAEAARRLGVTRARVSQIAKLRWLAPVIQERVLSGELRASERSVRWVAAMASWVEQGRRVGH